MISTALTSLLDLRAPVIGAPMAGVAGGSLAAAVSSAGGLGMIGTSGDTTVEFLTDECDIPRGAALRFGIGLMVWTLDRRPDLFEATVALRPDLVSVSFGDPAPYVPTLRDAGIPVATSVNTRSDLERAEAADVDVIVVQGTEAGGHTGHRAMLPLLQEVLQLTSRPVVAAGGIASGRGMAAALAAGAAGVWIGTALLCCPEGLNSPAARERIRATGGEATVLTRAFDVALGIPWPDRWPGRALVNDFSRHWHGHEEELAGEVDAREVVRRARKTGDVENAPLYAGEAVGLVTRERSATDVVREMSDDAETQLRQVGNLLR